MPTSGPWRLSCVGSCATEKKTLQQRRVRDLRRIERDLHRLGVTRAAGAHLLVARLVDPNRRRSRSRARRRPSCAGRPTECPRSSRRRTRPSRSSAARCSSAPMAVARRGRRTKPAATTRERPRITTHRPFISSAFNGLPSARSDRVHRPPDRRRRSGSGRCRPSPALRRLRPRRAASASPRTRSPTPERSTATRYFS